MEIKESERIVIAKPVPSRPTCSTFGPFSELLAGAISASPPILCSETAVVAIKPKTVRFKPMVNRAPPDQAELSRTAISNSSDKVLKSDNIKPTVVYKPLAKLASKSTVSLLANMGNFNTCHQLTQQLVESRVQHQSQDKHNFRSQIMPAVKETDQTTESSKMASQNMEEDPKTLPAAAAGDRPSYDGYNWRKYGQKQVKGSEYPRSYYKCTHPNCPVKKKVERSFDGQIAEIVYKGEHNHAKPQPPKRSSSGTQGVGLVSDTGQNTNNPGRNSRLNERNEGSDGRVENHYEVGLLTHSTYQDKAPLPYDPVAAGANTAGGGTSDYSCGLSGECDERRKLLEGEDDEPRNKRRKSENQSNEVSILDDGVQDPRIVVQSSMDSEILSDGFRWRKYGQKVVKGNAYPRSYYRCTNLNCNVRKHVERASDDPRAYITTYEGKHNHEMPPLRSAHPAASEPDSSAPAIKE